MSTGNLIYRSRRVTEDLQFTANGETSWSFIAEGDGEIFAVERNNVASYTINGGAITLPYSLINGNSYTVAITKTTGGQVADIQLKTRRSLDKVNVINVPDSNAPNADGRYSYFLLANNKIVKVDNGELRGNWDSVNEVFTGNHIVAEVTLPTPTNIPQYDLYHNLELVYDYNTNVHYCIGYTADSASNRVYTINVCKVDENLNVSNLDGTADAYTYVPVGFGSTASVPLAVCFGAFLDYINNKLYISLYATYASGNSGRCFIVNVVDGTQAFSTDMNAIVGLKGIKCVNPVKDKIQGTVSLLEKDSLLSSTFTGAYFTLNRQNLYDRLNGVIVAGGSDNGAYTVISNDNLSTRGQAGTYNNASNAYISKYQSVSSLFLTASGATAYHQSVFVKNITNGHSGFYGLSALGTTYNNSPTFGLTSYGAASDFSGLGFVLVQSGTSTASREDRLDTVFVLDLEKAKDLTASGVYDGFFDVGYLTFEDQVLFVSTNQIL